MATENQPRESERTQACTSPAPTPEERFRPAPRSSAGWLLLALLVGLLPTFAAAFLLWQQARHLHRQQEERLAPMLQQLEQSRWRDRQLRESLRQSRESWRQLFERTLRLEQQLVTERLRDRVLAPLKGKTAKEIAEDQTLRRQLEKIPEVATLVFLDTADGQLVRSFPELASVDQPLLKKELQQAQAAAEESGWLFVPVAESTVKAAWKMRMETAPDPVPTDAPEGEISVSPLQQLQHDLARLERNGRLALFVAPAVGLLLGLVLFLGLRRRWWRPLKDLSRQAELLLEERPVAWTINGGAGDDLAVSLQRLQQRLERLAELELWQAQTRREAALLQEAVQLAARGGLQVRLPLLEGELLLLGQAVRQLLESWESRLQGLALAAARMQSAGESLRRLAGELAVEMSQRQPPADYSTVSHMLTISLEALHQALSEHAVAPPESAAVLPQQPQMLLEAATTIEELSALFDSLAAQGLKLQEAGALLHTQLTLSERSGVASQEALGLALRLRQETENLFSGLQIKTSRLQQAARLNRQQLETLLAAVSQFQHENDRRLDFCRRQFERAGALLKQLQALLPIGRSLADTFSRLRELVEQQGQQLERLRQTLQRLSESAAQLSELSRVALRDIELMGLRAATPAEFSRELAASQSALERALRLLEESGRRNQLRLHEPQVEQLLEQIQQAARAARERLDLPSGEGDHTAGG